MSIENNEVLTDIYTKKVKKENGEESFDENFNHATGPNACSGQPFVLNCTVDIKQEELIIKDENLFEECDEEFSNFDLDEKLLNKNEHNVVKPIDIKKELIQFGDEDSETRLSENHSSTESLINTFNSDELFKPCSVVLRRCDYNDNASKQNSGKEKFICKLCRKRFTLQNDLTLHLEDHFTCDTCKEVFFEYKDIKRHIMFSHLKGHYKYGNHLKFSKDIKQFKCSVCDKKISRLDYLKIHMRLHTGLNAFKCSKCGKRFSQHGHLKVHERVHTGERPHKCKVCNKGFPQPFHLKIHMNTHSGEKPFVCSQCRRAFGDPSSLKRHLVLHTGLKRFKCKKCHRKFAQSHHLKVHQKVHK